MGKTEDALATQLANIETRYNTTIAALVAKVRESGLEKHGQIVKMLKDEVGMGHGDANAVAHQARTVPPDAADGPADGWYAGSKAALRPIHDQLLGHIAELGGDVEHSPKKTYLSLRRKRQFATVGPAARGTVEIGINLKGEPGDERMEALGPGKMCTHRTRIGSADEIDAALLGWLKRGLRCSRLTLCARGPCAVPCCIHTQLNGGACVSTMTIEESFEATTTKDAVYAFLRDPARCFNCLPGATYGQTYEDGRFDGTITVQVGPLRVSYEGWAKYENEDPESGTLVLTGQGRESGGGGLVTMNMTCKVVQDGTIARAEVVAEVGLAGRLVRFGRGLVKGVSAEVFREFSNCARTQLESAAPPAQAAPAADPFGAPAAADPFGAPGATAPAADPFGAPPADPFGGSPAPADATADAPVAEASPAPAAPQTPAPAPAKPANGLMLFFRALWRMIFGSRD